MSPQDENTSQRITRSQSKQPTLPPSLLPNLEGERSSSTSHNSSNPPSSTGGPEGHTQSATVLPSTTDPSGTGTTPVQQTSDQSDDDGYSTADEKSEQLLESSEQPEQPPESSAQPAPPDIQKDVPVRNPAGLQLLKTPPSTTSPPSDDPEDPSGPTTTMSEAGSEFDKGNSKIPSLKGSNQLNLNNWSTWSIEMKNLLYLDGTLGVLGPLIKELKNRGSGQSLDPSTLEKLAKPIDYDNPNDETGKLIRLDAIINASITSTAKATVIGLADPVTKWVRLEEASIGAGPVQYQYAIEELQGLRTKQFKQAADYINKFGAVREKLAYLGRKVPEVEYCTQFILGAEDDHPQWAVRMRGGLRSNPASTTLKVIQQDLLDERRTLISEASNWASNRRPQIKSRSRTPCPHIGHSANNCWSLHPEKRPSNQDQRYNNAKSSRSQNNNNRSNGQTNNHTTLQSNHSFNSNTKETKNYSFSTVARSTDKQPQKDVCLDSGSTCHIFTDKRLFKNLSYNQMLPTILTGGGEVSPLGVGEITLQCWITQNTFNKVHLREVYYCPDFAKDIVSLPDLYRKGLHLRDFDLVTVDGDVVAKVDKDFHIRLTQPDHHAYATIRSKFQTAKPTMTSVPAESVSTIKSVPTTTAPEFNKLLAQWHTRFGHISKDRILKNAEAVTGLEELAQSPPVGDLLCWNCDLNKIPRWTPRGGFSTPSAAGEVWHFDSFQIQQEGIHGERYGLLGTDGKFAFRQFEAFESKTTGPAIVIRMITKAEQNGAKVKRIHLDGGTELWGRDDDGLNKYLNGKGIIKEPSTPYTPEQNGLAERSNRIIVEKARCWMKGAQIPLALWTYVYQAAVDITNLTINSRTESLRISSYEAYNNELRPGLNHRPNLTNAFTPGTKIIAHIPSERRSDRKNGPAGEEGILLNWAWNDPTKPFTIFRCYLKDRPSAAMRDKIVQVTNLTLYETVGTDQISHRLEGLPETIVDSITAGQSSGPLIERSEAPISGRTRKRTVQLPVKLALLSNVSLKFSFLTKASAKTSKSTTPVSLQEALTGPDGPAWRDALNKEFRNLVRLNVFKARDRRKGQNRPLSVRHVLKAKTDQNGDISEYKIRTVIRGFEQREGIDFNETYAAVSKAPTWRILLTIAASLDWEIDQVDVVAAFLNGNLEEQVLIEIPEGFKEFLDKYPNENTIGFDHDRDQVLEVYKSLYGLKQAPRQWQKRLTTVLTGLGFHQLITDNAIYTHYTKKVIIGTYVDDLLIMGPNRDVVNSMKDELKREFEIKDLGMASYYLGVRITRNRPQRYLLLSQEAYNQRCLEELGVDDLKPAATPLATGSLVLATPNQDQATAEAIYNYQSGVGRLMYSMTQTRPDLAFLLSVISRYSHNPSTNNEKLLGHSFRYLTKTKNFALKIGRPDRPIQIQWNNKDFRSDIPNKQSLDVVAWVDSDWKGDRATGKSTFGFIVQINDSTVHWRSKRTDRVMASTTEAEYHGVYQAMKALLWIRNLLFELRIPASYTIKCDNQGAVKLTKNPEFHQRTGHIPIDEHFVRNEIASKRVTIDWVPTNDQLADGLTKPLASNRHNTMTSRLGLVTINNSLIADQNDQNDQFVTKDGHQRC